MSGGDEAHGVPIANQPERDSRLDVDGQPAEAAALHRLQASRARIRAAMEMHIRETMGQQGAPLDAPRSLGQRLLQRAQRLPIVRTALAIRDFRRG